ncbi:MAG: hypothetical protein Q8S36_10045 [Sulfuricurvum sp.]|nr:hypothetical protein [Sulfuricurvum sp.]
MFDLKSKERELIGLKSQIKKVKESIENLKVKKLKGLLDDKERLEKEIREVKVKNKS